MWSMCWLPSSSLAEPFDAPFRDKLTLNLPDGRQLVGIMRSPDGFDFEVVTIEPYPGFVSHGSHFPLMGRLSPLRKTDGRGGTSDACSRTRCTAEPRPHFGGASTRGSRRAGRDDDVADGPTTTTPLRLRATASCRSCSKNPARGGLSRTITKLSGLHRHATYVPRTESWVQ